MRRFLGLVRYLNAFLPRLAIQSEILSRLTLRKYEKGFPEWTDEYEIAFQNIKEIVTSRECLTVIDHNDPSKKIFVTTDASDTCSGAVLSFGETWEGSRPVAFDSMTFKGAELNYPVHEKELLAILRAIRRWKVDLLGSEFLVYTDHKTLLNFENQKDLSRRQARWMEELSIYNCKFVYVKGEDNTVADALSRFPHAKIASLEIAEASASHPYHFCPDEEIVIASIMPGAGVFACVTALSNNEFQRLDTKITLDPKLVSEVVAGYTSDPWCQKLLSASRGVENLIIRNGLWFLSGRLIILANCALRTVVFQTAHDALGHFGFAKTYGAIRDSYFWPNMRKDLEESYIPGCADCQRNKAGTTKPAGPLHPLPIPDARCESVALDFIGPLPEDDGYNMILTMTDRLGSDVRIVPVRSDITAKQLAVIFFDEWYCENGLPLNIVSDRDKLFLSNFWKELCKLVGIETAMSSAYHPESDGASERTNKTVNQCLRFHVARNQTGWKRALKRVRFHIMSTVNASTGYSPFQLRFGQQPKILPSLIDRAPEDNIAVMSAKDVIEQVMIDVASAKDNLMVAKISQAYHANARRQDAPVYEPGDKVMLSTLNRRRDYRNADENRVAKFMPRFDGPYEVIHANFKASTVTLSIPNAPNVFPTFHTSLVKMFRQNDDDKFPQRTLHAPGPVTVDGFDEYFVDKFIDHKKIGSKVQYLVRWVGEGPEEDRWIAGEYLDKNEALDRYWANHPGGNPFSLL